MPLRRFGGIWPRMGGNSGVIYSFRVQAGLKFSIDYNRTGFMKQGIQAWEYALIVSKMKGLRGFDGAGALYSRLCGHKNT